ncbi:Gene 25-like lysozyme [Providencia rustigianii]|nr:Gene 25-like lysozyme [Providencia rustigianii]
MKYQGMNRIDGKTISDIEHIRQSVRDILITPIGSRIARRAYGSLLSELIDQPQNPALKLQLMSACLYRIDEVGTKNFINSDYVELRERGSNGH